MLLHPGLADVYRRKVENLTEALNQDDLRAGCRGTALDDPDDPADSGKRGAGDQTRRGTRRNTGADQREKPELLARGFDN
jgi:hypothetical protein